MNYKINMSKILGEETWRVGKYKWEVMIHGGQNKFWQMLSRNSNKEQNGWKEIFEKIMAETSSKLSKGMNFQIKVTEGVTEQGKRKQIHI